MPIIIKINKILSILLLILLIISSIIGKIDSQANKFQILYNKNVTDQDCGSFLKVSTRVIDRLLCMSHCPKVSCNLVSFDSNNNQCRIYNIPLTVLQQAGLSFISTSGTNLYFSQSFILKPFNGSFKSIIYIHTAAVNSVIKLSNGDLVSASDDNKIKYFNLDGTVKRTLISGSGWVTCLVEIPNGYFASGSQLLKVHIWKSDDGALVRTLTGHSQWIMSLIYIPSVSRLASGSSDCTIKIWDPYTGVLYTTLTSHTSWVSTFVLLPNGDLVSGSGDCSIKIWDVNNFSQKSSFLITNSPIRSMLVLQNGNVATGYEDNTIKIWQPSDRTLIKTLSGHTGHI